MTKSKGNKRESRNLRTRKRLWPDLSEEMVWNRKTSDGFVSIPRTMPYFFKIMDDCSKSKPVSSTFFALWCRCWDISMLVTNKNSGILAEESGFSGQRAITTWRTRMRILEKLGFIKAEPLGAEKFGYIVVLNPYKISKKLYDNKQYTDKGWFNALIERAEEIKADDLNDEDDE